MLGQLTLTDYCLPWWGWSTRQSPVGCKGAEDPHTRVWEGPLSFLWAGSGEGRTCIYTQHPASLKGGVFAFVSRTSAALASGEAACTSSG